MSKNPTVLVTLSHKHRDQLRRMAAENNFKKPDQVTTAAGLIRQIVTQYLERIDPENQSKGDERSQDIKSTKENSEESLSKSNSWEEERYD